MENTAIRDVPGPNLLLYDLLAFSYPFCVLQLECILTLEICCNHLASARILKHLFWY